MPPGNQVRPKPHLSRVFQFPPPEHNVKQPTPLVRRAGQKGYLPAASTTCPTEAGEDLVPVSYTDRELRQAAVPQEQGDGLNGPVQG